MRGLHANYSLPCIWAIVVLHSSHLFYSYPSSIRGFDAFCTTFLHPCLVSANLSSSHKAIPAQGLMLSIHLIIGLPLALQPGMFPCIVSFLHSTENKQTRRSWCCITLDDVFQKAEPTTSKLRMSIINCNFKLLCASAPGKLLQQDSGFKIDCIYL